MRRIRIGLLMVAMLIFTLCFIPAQADSTSIFGDNLTSSVDEIRTYFDMTEQGKVTTTTENDVPIIYMEAAETGHWIISKDPVDLAEFTYTVNVACAEGSGREISIFVGADSRYLNGFQVYLTKRGSDTVSVQAAERKSGVYTKVLDEYISVDYSDSSECYFKIQLQVIGSDMDIYVNGEYVNSVYVEKGFNGRVGVRCTGTNNAAGTSDLRIKELSLIGEIIDIQPEENTPVPQKTDNPAQTPGQEATTAPTKAPTQAPTNEPVTTINPTQVPSDPNNDVNNDEVPVALVGGIVLGAIVCICAIAVVTYMVIKKKSK